MLREVCSMNDAMEILRNRSRETLEISESIRIINEEFNDAFETNEDHPAARVGDAADLAYKIAMLKSLEEIILQLYVKIV